MWSLQSAIHNIPNPSFFVVIFSIYNVFKYCAVYIRTYFYGDVIVFGPESYMVGTDRVSGTGCPVKPSSVDAHGRLRCKLCMHSPVPRRKKSCGRDWTHIAFESSHAISATLANCFRLTLLQSFEDVMCCLRARHSFSREQYEREHWSYFKDVIVAKRRCQALKCSLH